MDNEQPLDPPEPRRYVTWEEYLEHEADRLNDEEFERNSWLPDDNS